MPRKTKKPTPPLAPYAIRTVPMTHIHMILAVPTAQADAVEEGIRTFSLALIKTASPGWITGNEAWIAVELKHEDDSVPF